MSDVSVTDAAYAAGLIDGEGTISIARIRRCEVSDQYYYHWTISVGNTAYEMVAFFQDRWGGGVRPVSGQKGRKPQWVWAVVGSSAIQCLEDVFPYLRIKRRQAENARALYQLLQLSKPYNVPQGRFGSRPRPPWLVAAQERLYQSQKILNRRGLAPPEEAEGADEIVAHARRDAEAYVPPAPRPPRLCVIEGCDRPIAGHGWCAAHLRRWHKYGDPLGSRPRKVKPPCLVDGCEGTFFCRGLCRKHYSRWWYSTRRPLVRGLGEAVSAG